MSDRNPDMTNDNTNNQDTTPANPQKTRPFTPKRDDDTVPTTPTQTLPAADDTKPPSAPVPDSATSSQQPERPATPQPPRRQRSGNRQRRPGYRPRPNRRQTDDASDSALYLPWWSLVVMLVGVLIIAVGLVGVVYLLGSRGASAATAGNEPTPIIRIITSAPNDTGAGAAAQVTAQPPSTQIIAGGDAPSSLSLQGPTLEAVQFTPTAAPITVDSTVRVEGVGDQELNVRDEANITTSSVVFRVKEGTQFRITDGPQQGDGFTWWRIQDPADPTRSGWAVSNYLTVVASSS